MKRLKLWAVLLTSMIILTACGDTEDTHGPIILEPEPIESQEDIPDSSTGNTFPEEEQPLQELIIVDDTNPPEEGMVRSRLTNEWVSAEVATTRPIAVMTPNEVSALPHYNLSNASILYEANVEGRMTRMMAIYEDWQNLEKIGNIRSLRAYYAYWSFEWDAILLHFGGPFFINDLLAQPTTQNIDGNLGSNTDAFFRTDDRKAPHNAYASGAGIADVMADKDYSSSYRGLTEDNHFKFTPKIAPNTLEQYGDEAKSATYVDMTGCYPLTRCYFEFNEDDGLYYRFQHLSGGTDGPHMDEATGEQLKFKNILIQYTKHEDLGEGYLAMQCHDTTRDGWYFTNGKGIHVTWEKTSDYGATRYFDDAGNEIILNTGKTMICIAEDGDTFSFR